MRFRNHQVRPAAILILILIAGASGCMGFAPSIQAEAQVTPSAPAMSPPPLRAAPVTPSEPEEKMAFTPEVERPAVATPPASGEIEAGPKPENRCSRAALGESVLLFAWSAPLAQNILTPTDPESGQPLCGYEPVPFGKYPNYTFSPDGRLLAAVISRRDDNRDSALHLIDPKTWQNSGTTLEFDNWVAALEFSPDSQRLAIVSAGPPRGPHGWPEFYSLTSLDTRARTVLVERKLDFAPRLLEYTPDGAAVVAYGTEMGADGILAGLPHALLMEANTLETSWETTLPGLIDGQVRIQEGEAAERYAWMNPAVVFAPQEQVLYIVHADGEKLTAVDFARRTASTRAIQPARSWIERLLGLTATVARAKTLDGTTKTALLSPDGRHLFLVGQTSVTEQDEQGNFELSQSPLGLRMIEIPIGAEIRRLETAATEMARAPDGNRLYLRGWSEDSAWSEVVDLARLELEDHLEGRWLIPGRRLNGEPVLLSSTEHYQSGTTTLALFHPESLQEIHKWSLPTYAGWLIRP